MIAWAVSALCFGAGLVAVLMARTRTSFPSFALPLVWLLALVLFGLTLPGDPTPYFRPGGALGWGILTTTGLGLVGAYLSLQRRWHSVGASLLLLAPILALSLQPEGIPYALWGVGIALSVLWLILGHVWRGLEAGALSTLALSWTIALSGYAGMPRWYTVCVAGVGIGILWLVAFLARTRPLSWGWGVILLFAGFTVVAVGYRLSGSNEPWLTLVLMTLVAVALAKLFSGWGEGARYALLIWIALMMGVFTTLRGFGMGVSALMVSLYALVIAQSEQVESDSTERTLATAGAFLLTMVLGFRLFVVSYPLGIPRADLYAHPALVGFLLALVGLGALAHWWSQNGTESPWGQGVFSGILAGVAPLLMTLLFTERAGSGWLAGALGGGLSAYLYHSNLQRWLFPLAMTSMVSGLALTPLVGELGMLERSTKLLIVGSVLAVVLLVVGVDARFRQKNSSTS
ncbi:MAG: hypothetical protein SNJ72_03770 [Fimbriimonadales bacterium]